MDKLTKLNEYLLALDYNRYDALSMMMIGVSLGSGSLLALLLGLGFMGASLLQGSK